LNDVHRTNSESFTAFAHCRPVLASRNGRRFPLNSLRLINPQVEKSVTQAMPNQVFPSAHGYLGGTAQPIRLSLPKKVNPKA
jgi:hypothetical protein